MDWSYLFRKYTSTWRTLPNFIIAGSQKAGTTSLLYYLSQHPDVAISPRKEVNYFNLSANADISEYKHYFPLKMERSLNKRLQSGEATPDYMIYRQVPALISKIVPDVKIILLLRNPVDRAYSHYAHNLMMKREWLTFEDALKYEDIRIGKDYIDVYKCRWDAIKNYSNYSYRTRGIYYEQLQWFLSSFKRENVLVIQSEEFFKNPLLHVNKTLSFLELHSLPAIDAEPQNTKQVKVERDEKTRNDLLRFYEPHNSQLFQILKEQYSWK